jgi:hypothetical protein
MKPGREENAYTRFRLRSECFCKRKDEGHLRMRDIQPVEKDGENIDRGHKMAPSGHFVMRCSEGWGTLYPKKIIKGTVS